jgi:putative CocE/NonD family hydrolase
MQPPKKAHPRRVGVLFLLFLFLFAFDGIRVSAQQPQASPVPAVSPTPFPDPPVGFEKAEHRIRMRDGVQLYTIVYAPKQIREPLPFLFLRTPYGVSGWGYRAIPRYLKPFADVGYIFVFQDIRGRYKSEGSFVMGRPLRDKSDKQAIDESTDAYDTIDWLVKNIPNNNGRVGMTGGSYDAELAIMAMLDPHPALKAICEQASPADSFLGDDFYHHGAFRLSYGFEYAYQLESSREDQDFKFDRYDTYEWYLRLGALANADARYFHGKLPTWNNFANHPTYDAFWKQQALGNSLTRATVPTMHVAGWWDQEDFTGPVKAYQILEKTDTDGKNFLVVGPWNHGGWDGEGSKLGKIDFESATGRYFREHIMAPWLNYCLKQTGKNDQADTQTFQTGSNKWQTYDVWPPRKNVSARKLYFQSKGLLSFELPSGAGDKSPAYDSYLSDPAHPVPYRQRPIEATYFPAGSGWYNWLVEDQRFAQGRPDVLSWESQTLTQDVTVSGNILAHLFASTTGSDADWIVKLIDVYPEEYPKDVKMGGYQLMIANDVLRGRFRRSFERAEPITPNKFREYVVDMHATDHVFLKGHKIMVQVQSTWFPVIDRNPQTFVANIFKALEEDYRAATHRISRSPRLASYIELPILSAGGK